MQRILKYHLLLDKLVEETPRDWKEDRSQLEKARDVMVDIAHYINEVKRDSDTLDIIHDIQTSIIDWDRPEDVQLKDYGRLLKDGELKVNKFILFVLCFMYCCFLCQRLKHMWTKG